MQKPLLLMCPPDYFGVHYVINPWMEGHIDDTFDGLAARQWNELLGIVEDRADVVLVPPQPGLPDLVFTANAALVRGKTAILSSFLHPERQGEEPHFQTSLSERGFNVHTLPREVSFEGAGDALFDRRLDLLWFGHGVRSSILALPYFERLLNIEVQPLTLLQTRFYHLDTCFCPLTGGYLLYYPDAFDAASNAAIERRVAPELRLAVSEGDAFNFACNAINLDRTLILHRLSDRSKQWLADRQFDVIETSTTEFLKAGGSAKCLSLRLDEQIG